jgi:hypothetical protein
MTSECATDTTTTSANAAMRRIILKTSAPRNIDLFRRVNDLQIGSAGFVGIFIKV